MSDLAEQTCLPCEGGVDPLSITEAEQLRAALHADWRLDAERPWLLRTFEFAGFSRTMAFVNAVAWVATVEGHHPQLLVDYGRCEVRYRTNAIDGLSRNDFICAAKIDRLVQE